MHVTLILTDQDLVVSPIIPDLSDCLTYRHKSMDEDRTSSFEEVRLFSHTPDGQALVTHQGLFARVRGWCIEQGYDVTLHDARRFNAKPDFSKTFGMRFSQPELLKTLLDKNMSGLFEAPTRWGKCHSPDDRVLTYDYEVVKVRDLHNGDKLMGPDGSPRVVAGLRRGHETMYRVVPNKGETWCCNESHILSLKVTGGAKFGGYKKGDIVNISVRDYMKRSKTFKHVTKLWYSPLEFSHKVLPYDPWVVGVWLGDGRADGACLMKPEPELMASLRSWAEVIGIRYEMRKQDRPDDTIQFFQTGWREKHAFQRIAELCTKEGQRRVPRAYLTASVEQRLQLLAGLLDTDGYLNNGMGYEIVTVYPGLAEDIIRLCRGLGLRVTCADKKGTIDSTGFEGWYKRLNIHGAIHEIPLRITRKRAPAQAGRVDPTTTGFTLEKLDTAEYMGFEVEGPDHLYLLWDHCVTHNTSIIVNTLRAFGRRKTVVCAPGVDLLKQLQQALTKALPGREVVGIYTGSRNKHQGADITVVSMDSLEKCDFEGTELVLVDEPHAAVTESRGFLLHSFKNARRYGFGATLHGRFDKADILIEALFGPVLARRTFVEAVNEGAICMIAPIIVRVPLSHKIYRTREMAYKHLLWENKDMVELIRRISEEVIPKEFQGLIFINNEKQADAIHGALAKNDPEAVVAMAKKLDTKSRAALFEKVTGGGVRRCVASSIYSTGVTFPDIRWAMNAEGMAAYISCVQKPGRLAEIKPGKKFGILFDFQFVKPACVNAQQVTAWEQNTGGQCLVNDSGRRLSIYLGKGYAVRTVPAEIDAIKKAFDALL